MRVLVTGGCGYIGSVLVPKLAAAGHEVSIADLMWFWDQKACASDFREYADLSQWGAVIHLAAIANDPTGDLDPKLTWETNALGTMQLAERAARSGVKQFIYASSGSVYGVSDAPEVREDHPLVPLTEYNKTKAVAERCLLSYTDKMAVQILRPATVCGVSPRQRLDVVVNRFAMQALTRGEITVRGGSRMRPNISIADMTDLYLWMLNRPHLTGIWNAGFENLSVLEIAELVSRQLGGKIKVEADNDPRSYRMNSDKLLSVGFRPRKSVTDAIWDIAGAYQRGELREDDNCHNVKVMQRLKIA